MNALLPPPQRVLLSIRRLRVPRDARHGLRHKGHPEPPIEFFDLNLARGESLVIIGETGSGKSTLARAIAGLEPGATGSVHIEGVELLDNAPAEIRATWTSRVQLVGRQPLADASPRARVATLVEKHFKDARLKAARTVRQQRTVAACQKLGIAGDMAHQRIRALGVVDRYRVALAQALSCEPKILVCDTPLADHAPAERDAIRSLILHTCAEQHLTLIVTALSAEDWRPSIRRISVLCLGRVMEQGDTTDILERPVHPYTRALLTTAAELITPHRGAPRTEVHVEGPRPDAGQPPIGCVFHPRCPLADTACVREIPPLRRTGRSPRHYAACLFLEPVEEVRNDSISAQ